VPPGPAGRSPPGVTEEPDPETLHHIRTFSEVKDVEWVCNRLEENMKTLYTAEAVVEGGRAGHGRTSDGRLDVDLSVPEDVGGQGGDGTNPEQLFAVGYAACFQSALLNIANGRKLDASDSRITSRVALGPTGHGGMGLAVALDLHAPHVSSAEAADLMARAHELCPYSNATRGNIDVSLTIDGVSLEVARAA
jgi:Ohr subfamily peroxiredoxin